eukprot:Nk52_evm7s373 gene=Nk52_evmTU7s373
MSSEAEQKLQGKKRLDAFSKECMNIGLLSGFRYFQAYVRGKEELTVTVVNRRKTPNPSNQASKNPTPQAMSVNSVSGASHPLVNSGAVVNTVTGTSLSAPVVGSVDKREKEQKIMSPGSQAKKLETERGDYRPESPCNSETFEDDPKETVFLLAGYARYQCPFVWLRTNHTRIALMFGDEFGLDNVRDKPLGLASTRKWKVGDVYAWEMIAEIVDLCIVPSPSNPFAIDRSYYEDGSMSSFECTLNTAAMINFLVPVYLSEKLTMAKKKLYDDICWLQSRHFEEVALHEQGLKASSKGGGKGAGGLPNIKTSS